VSPSLPIPRGSNEDELGWHSPGGEELLQPAGPGSALAHCPGTDAERAHDR
jgi:hypothetical protein